MLSQSLPTDLRTTFKTVEFRSINHLYDVCRSFGDELEYISLPSLPDDNANFETSGTCSSSESKAIRQALKDLKRETITVNGDVLPSVNSVKELVKLLTRTINARTNSMPCPLLTSEIVVLKDGYTSEESSLCSSEDICQLGDSAADTIPESGIVNGPRHTLEKRTIDKLIYRLLFAAGRTGIGGDAYFVVRDLFGGDDVIVVPSNSQPKYATSRHCVAEAAAGTIEIIVRLASITIKCHSCYYVYPRSVFDSCASCDPLITLHTVTTEIISLQNVRTRDAIIAGGDYNNLETNNLEEQDNVLMLKEKITSMTGKRILSVIPVHQE